VSGSIRWQPKWREPRLRAINPLHHVSVDFHGHRSLQHFHGQEELPQILLAEQDPFKSLEWACVDPDPIAAFDERVRFSSEGTLNHPSDSLNFGAGDHGRLPAESYYSVNSRGGKNWQPTFDWAAEEYVAGEERERKLLDSVFPTVYGVIERKESFESLAG
jgi:hypothetical protein